MGISVLEIFLRELTQVTERYGILIDAKRAKLISVTETKPMATGLVYVEGGYITNIEDAEAAEFEAKDGSTRKLYYGLGEQPWDTMVRVGWAPDFAGGNILKYLRRRKSTEHSIESARWYYPALIKLAETSPNASVTLTQLHSLLRREEVALLQTK